MDHKSSITGARFRWGSLLAVLLILMVACGNETNPTTGPTTVQITPAVTVTTVASGQPTAPAATTASSQLPATTSAITPSQGQTTRAATTTAPTITTPLPTVAPTVAQAGSGQRPPIGNTYPAGPAPTVAPPAGGLVETTLQVPDALKKGNFTQPRKVLLP